MNKKSIKLAEFVKNLTDFEFVSELDGNYGNMGATIIDGILQAGINYNSTVKPRVTKFLTEYPECKTTSQFIDLYNTVTLSELINWKQSSKTVRIETLSEFLKSNDIETIEDFSSWLADDSNLELLKKLPGVKCKTADYFRILTGHETNAIDRHLINFIKLSGSQVSSYKEAHNIVSETSEILGIKESLFDHSIWKYMSSKA
ncbi:MULTISPECIES: hypothetical protein [Vibrio]|uniref:Uncharacterized protein n=2 Tax=Vibrio TaxID=662 RepID=A0ABN5HFG5_9VIBR|nr:MULTISPECIES: hypothetical protein [Vibrio]HAV1572319.1 hypothetical protein [Vibrio parahaemolyticus]AVH25807.1 hypothetical protein AL468_00455 [Vibrio diabolicus]EHD0131851.1 hypothetical protein [Vibrio alginolyticus]ELA9205228.1 hypothetical protein [Vibrio alginolyticus]KPM85699.1 hypothetical protein AOR09_23280 [Vibrio alginolyticus]